MNHKKVYSKLVKKAKLESREKGSGTYYELHHIKPSSLFPELKSHKGNLVLLTAREHYIAHKLLVKIYPGKSMWYAFMVMCNKATKDDSKRTYKVSSKDFAAAKEYFSVNNPAKGKEARKKISKSKKGSNHHFFGIASEESPGFKGDVFTFVHKSGTELTGTRTDLFNGTELTRANVSNLISGYRYSAKGWSLKGTTKPKAKSGKAANGADKTLYCWYNKNTGTGYVCDRYAFETLVGIKRKSIQTLIYKTRNSVHGWELQR